MFLGVLRRSVALNPISGLTFCSRGAQQRAVSTLYKRCSTPLTTVGIVGRISRREFALKPSMTRSLSWGKPSMQQVSPKAEIPASPLPVLPSPAVGGWLMFSSVLVLGIIVVGGVTRLTESGLSITEWKPITGVLPPLNHDDWLVEFEKYKATPEFKLYVCLSC